MSEVDPSQLPLEGHKQSRLSSFHDWLEQNNIQLVSVHTSGHASQRDLQRLASAIKPKSLVPIHSFETHRFVEFFANVEQKNDGTWWSVG